MHGTLAIYSSTVIGVCNAYHSGAHQFNIDF